MKAFAAYYDNSIRMYSSSGGLFSLIASKFDVVYGVAMTKDCYGAEYIRAEGNISPLRGSKYIQAKMGDIFIQVKKDLLEGKNVLFTGTGCQINGLSAFLGKQYENLFLMDIVCHGVPSPKLWKEYAEYQEKKHGKLEKVNFRCKNEDWSHFGMKENRLYIPKEEDPYMVMFLHNYCLRPSCYECHAKYYKKADITIADFWGIKYIAPDMNDGKGTSLVITRTDKGINLFDSIKTELKWREVSYEEAIKRNSPEYKSVTRPSERNVFFKDMNSLEFKKLVKKYVVDKRSSKLKYVLKFINRRLKLIKNIIGGAHE